MRTLILGRGGRRLGLAALPLIAALATVWAVSSNPELSREFRVAIGIEMQGLCHWTGGAGICGR